MLYHINRLLIVVINIQNMFTCEHCETVFSTQGALVHHQKSALYCLQKQGITAPNVDLMCPHCDKTYSTSYRLRQHVTTCNAKRSSDDDCARLTELYELKLQAKDELVKKQQEEIDYLKSELSKRVDDLTDIAKQTKTKTSTTNNIVVNSSTLNLNDTSHIHSILQTHLDGNVLADGQRGLARMIKDQLLTDSQGQKKYKCTDRSRQQFEFIAPDGSVERDAKGSKLRDALVESHIKRVAMDHGEQLWKRADGSVDHARCDVFYDKVMEVALLNDDDTKFRSELSVLLS